MNDTRCFSEWKKAAFEIQRWRKMALEHLLLNIAPKVAKMNATSTKLFLGQLIIDLAKPMPSVHDLMMDTKNDWIAGNVITKTLYKSLLKDVQARKRGMK